MTFLRNLNAALGRMADRMQGQDIERHAAKQGSNFGADYAALMRSRTSQGISSIGLGR